MLTDVDWKNAGNRHDLSDSLPQTTDRSSSAQSGPRPPLPRWSFPHSSVLPFPLSSFLHHVRRVRLVRRARRRHRPGLTRKVAQIHEPPRAYCNFPLCPPESMLGMARNLQTPAAPQQH